MADYELNFLGVCGGREAIGSLLGGAGGFIFKFEGTQIHVDPGPGSFIQAKRAKQNLRQNHVVLVSSNLLDHSGDLNMLIDAITYSGLDKAGLLLCAKSIVERSEYERPILTRANKKNIQRFESLEPGQEVKVNDILIKAVNTKYKDPTAIGFKIKTKKFTLTYTADTSYDLETVNQYEGSDILIINNQLPSGSEQINGNPLSTDDTIKIVKEIKPRLVIINHFGAKLITSGSIYEARRIQGETGVYTIAAREGMSLDLYDLLKQYKPFV